jgi:ATP-dependent helicase/nuclease subunit B
MTGAHPASRAHPIFLGWDGPALPRAAKIMAREYAGPQGLDLRGVVVVTPAARAGRRLTELLLEEAEARGVPLTPPRTVTIGRFPELLYQVTGPLADSTICRHAFAQALKSVEPGLLGEVFPELPPGLSGWMALAGIVEKLHREVGAEGLDFRDVSREFREGLPYDDSSRWDTLAQVQNAYLAILKEAGFRDRDRDRRQALGENRLVSPGDIWMVGVVELPRVVRKMVEALPDSVRCLIHAPEEVGDRFDSLGCYVPEAWKRVHIPLREERVQVVQRPRDQATVAAAVLRGFGGRYSAEEVVVGVPDPELVPFVERGLSGVDVPHRFAGGKPLEETGPVRLLQALADYLAGRPYPAFAVLIRHPDLHELVEAAAGDDTPEVTGALTIVDRFQSEHLQDSVMGPIPGEDKNARRTRALVKKLEEAMGLEVLDGTRPISEWMPQLLDVLVRVYGGQPLDRSKPSVRQVVDALDHVKGAATRLATLPRKLDTQVEAPEALATLVAELTGPEMTIPPDPGEHAVELLGWLELPLDDAPAVILTGVNERILPEAGGADPFLPGALRTRLGMPDDGARYARDAYLLSALVHSREEVHLVAGRATTKGDPVRPSRLLFADTPEEVARRIRRYLGDEEGEDAAGDASGPPAESASDPQAHPQSRFRSPPQDPLPALDSLPRIRVTDFATYLNDPYRYALLRVLDLGPLDDGAREMDGGVFGSLAHEVLERFGRSEEVGSPEPEVVERKLSQILTHAVRDKFGSRPVPAVRVQVEQLRARLRGFAQWQADWIQEGWRVVSVEEQPESGVPFEVDGKAVRLRGKIDRIDHNPGTGQWAIFDYKTSDEGKTPEKTHRKGRGENKEWIDLQLPLYRSLLPGILKEDGSPLVPEASWKDVILGYILLPRELDQVGASCADWTEADLADAHETAERVVRELRSEPFRYDPGTRSFRGDPLDPLLGRLELPRAADEDEGGEA